MFVCLNVCVKALKWHISRPSTKARRSEHSATFISNWSCFKLIMFHWQALTVTAVLPFSFSSSFPKTTRATLFFLEVLFKFSFFSQVPFLLITIVCLSSPYFGLRSVNVHEQQFRLFPLVFCKWYFYKQTHFQNKRGIVPLYPYIQTRPRQAGSESSLIKTKHHEKD